MVEQPEHQVGGRSQYRGSGVPKGDLKGMSTLQEDRQILNEQLGYRLTMANRRARRYRRDNTVLLLIAVIFGLLATTLAADSAKGGEFIAKPMAEATTGKAPSELPRGWRNVCGLIAMFTFAGTLATGINTALRITEHHSKAMTCAGLIDGLKTELMTEASLRRESLEKARADLARIVSEYPEYLR